MRNDSSIEKITTVCIPTCERKEMLERSLTGLIGNLNKYNRTPRILVIDDSENPENARITKDICESHQKNYAGIIESMDRAHREMLAIRLAKEKGVEEEVMRFALLGDKRSVTTLGSVQNTFFIKTRGEKILIVDDDVIYDFFNPIEKENPIFTPENPLSYWFLEEINDRSDNFKKTETDLLSLHENVLSRKIDNILGDNCPEYLEGYKILDSYMGSTGDSPMESHIPLIILSQVYENLKKMSVDQYKNIKETRRLTLSSIVPSVYQGNICISMVMGVDNRDLIPAFMPVGRAQDLVFGTVRWKAFTFDLSMHLPTIVRHDRPQREMRVMDYKVVYEMTKMNRVVSSLITGSECAGVDPKENLSVIGKRLHNISQKSENEFSIFIEGYCHELARSVGSLFENIILQADNPPEFWLKDMRDMEMKLSNPDHHQFLLDVTKQPNRDNIKVFQKWLSLYGQLLQVWPNLLS